MPRSNTVCTFFPTLLLAFLAFLLLTATPSFAVQSSVPGETEEERDARMAWWREARFGLFIHWGPVSLMGTEIGWSRGGERRGTGGTGTIPVEVYDNLYKQFNPVQFDADEWVRIAKEAGMKYMVFTSKHHDGFVNFDSKLTDYKITNPESPFGRDIVAELAEACHKGGLRIGFYYSPPDWHHPDYRTENHERYIKYMHGQLEEICTNYGKIDIIWFDGLGGKPEDWDAENLFRLIRKLQPETIINRRLGLPGDHDTPEQTIGSFQIDRPWETCMTICHQWAWKPNDKMKSLEECLQTFVRVAGGDGNFLFNVGPMPNGKIEPRQVERLREMGDWLKDYGESIYGTRGGPFKPGPWCASTHRDNRVYLHVFEWSGEKRTLPPIDAKVVASSLLTGGAVEVVQDSQGISVSVSPENQREIDTIVVLDLDRPAGEIPPVSVRSGSLGFQKKATASNVYQKMADHEPGKAFDDDESTRWATDAGVHQAWLEVDLGEERTVNRAVLDEAMGRRVRKFELQQKVEDGWETFHQGSRIGSSVSIEFEPVTARHFRLNILEAVEGPTITEFQLFGP